jgi:hypothetical protein
MTSYPVARYLLLDETVRRQDFGKFMEGFTSAKESLGTRTGDYRRECINIAELFAPNNNPRTTKRYADEIFITA